MGWKGTRANSKRPQTRPSFTSLLVLACLFLLNLGHLKPNEVRAARILPLGPRQLRPNIVVGKDDRVLVKNTVAQPFSAVVYLEITSKYGASSCSGVLLTRNAILTAASCLYLPKNLGRGVTSPTWVDSVTAYPGRNGGLWPLGGKIPTLDWHVPATYFQAASTAVGYTEVAAQSDLAVVRLKTPVAASAFLFGRRPGQPACGSFNMTGFPRNKGGTMWNSWCNATVNGFDPSVWVSCDAAAGEEGGPLWTYNWRQRHVFVGILVPDIPNSRQQGKLNRVLVLTLSTEAFLRRVLGLASSKSACKLLCSSNAVCVSDGTSAKCVCKSGFFGDGVTCYSHPCQSPGTCSVFATCTNPEPGVALCTCWPGYIGNGKTCARPTTTRVTSAKTTRTLTATTTTTRRPTSTSTSRSPTLTRTQTSSTSRSFTPTTSTCSRTQTTSTSTFSRTRTTPPRKTIDFHASVTTTSWVNTTSSTGPPGSGFLFGSTGRGYTQGNNLILDRAGNIYAMGWAGDWIGSYASYDPILFKLSKNGTVIWRMAHPGFTSSINAIAVDASGEIVTCGLWVPTMVPFTAQLNSTTGEVLSVWQTPDATEAYPGTCQSQHVYPPQSPFTIVNQDVFSLNVSIGSPYPAKTVPLEGLYEMQLCSANSDGVYCLVSVPERTVWFHGQKLTATGGRSLAVIQWNVEDLTGG